MISIIILDGGCAEKKLRYDGRFISVNVSKMPLDEFQSDGWTILAFEIKINNDYSEYEFWLFKDNKKIREIKLSRDKDDKFYLREQAGSKVKNHAVFFAPPVYDAVKESLRTSLLTE